MSIEAVVDYPTQETGVTHRGWVTRAHTGERFLRVDLTGSPTEAEQAAFDQIVKATMDVLEALHHPKAPV